MHTPTVPRANVPVAPRFDDTPLEVRIVQDILIRRSVMSGDEGLETLAELIKIAMGSMYFAIQSDYEFTRLWDAIRSKEPVAAFFLNVVHEFIVRMGGTNSDAMVAHLTAWAGAMSSTVSPDGYMDTTLKERVNMKDDAGTLHVMQANLWVVVLGTIAQVDYPAALKTIRESRRLLQAQEAPTQK